MLSIHDLHLHATNWYHHTGKDYVHIIIYYIISYNPVIKTLIDHTSASPTERYLFFMR